MRRYNKTNFSDKAKHRINAHFIIRVSDYYKILTQCNLANLTLINL